MLCFFRQLQKLKGRQKGVWIGAGTALFTVFAYSYSNRTFRDLKGKPILHVAEKQSCDHYIYATDLLLAVRGACGFKLASLVITRKLYRFPTHLWQNTGFKVPNSFFCRSMWSVCIFWVSYRAMILFYRDYNELFKRFLT